MLQWKLEYPSLQPKRRRSRRPFCGSVFPDGFLKKQHLWQGSVRNLSWLPKAWPEKRWKTVYLGSSMEVCSVLVESGLRDVGGTCWAAYQKENKISVDLLTVTCCREDTNSNPFCLPTHTCNSRSLLPAAATRTRTRTRTRTATTTTTTTTTTNHNKPRQTTTNHNKPQQTTTSNPSKLPTNVSLLLLVICLFSLLLFLLSQLPLLPAAFLRLHGFVATTLLVQLRPLIEQLGKFVIPRKTRGSLGFFRKDGFCWLVIVEDLKFWSCCWSCCWLLMFFCALPSPNHHIPTPKKDG